MNKPDTVDIIHQTIAEMIRLHGLKNVADGFTLAVVSQSAREKIERLQSERNEAQAAYAEMVQVQRVWRAAYTAETGRDHPTTLVKEIMKEVR